MVCWKLLGILSLPMELNDRKLFRVMPKKKKKGTIGKENTRKTYNVKLNYVEFFRGLIKNDMK